MPELDPGIRVYNFLREIKDVNSRVSHRVKPGLDETCRKPCAALSGLHQCQCNQKLVAAEAGCRLLRDWGRAKLKTCVRAP
jgi:hypothetical protein